MVNKVSFLSEFWLFFIIFAKSIFSFPFVSFFTVVGTGKEERLLSNYNNEAKK